MREARVHFCEMQGAVILRRNEGSIKYDQVRFRVRVRVRVRVRGTLTCYGSVRASNKVLIVLYCDVTQNRLYGTHR